MRRYSADSSLFAPHAKVFEMKTGHGTKWRFMSGTEPMPLSLTVSVQLVLKNYILISKMTKFHQKYHHFIPTYIDVDGAIRRKASLIRSLPIIATISSGNKTKSALELDPNHFSWTTFATDTKHNFMYIHDILNGSALSNVQVSCYKSAMSVHFKKFRLAPTYPFSGDCFDIYTPLLRMSLHNQSDFQVK